MNITLLKTERVNITLINLDASKNVYILGDFNIDIVSNSFDAKERYGIKNVIKEGAGITRDSNKLIDLCITTDNFNNKSGVIKKQLSYHLPAYIIHSLIKDENKTIFLNEGKRLINEKLSKNSWR